MLHSTDHIHAQQAPHGIQHAAESTQQKPLTTQLFIHSPRTQHPQITHHTAHNMQHTAHSTSSSNSAQHRALLTFRHHTAHSTQTIVYSTKTNRPKNPAQSKQDTMQRTQPTAYRRPHYRCQVAERALRTANTTRRAAYGKQQTS